MGVGRCIMSAGLGRTQIGTEYPFDPPEVIIFYFVNSSKKFLIIKSRIPHVKLSSFAVL